MNREQSAPVRKRNSIQKQMIADALNALCHPTAAQVYELIREKYPNISLATVYRNLGAMAECGIVEKIAFPDEPDRFELTHRPHFHAICRRCGGVSDIGGIGADLLDALDRSILAEEGFCVSERNLNFTGICAACRKEEKSVSL